jgi:hypothetical protein
VAKVQGQARRDGGELGEVRGDRPRAERCQDGGRDRRRSVRARVGRVVEKPFRIRRALGAHVHDDAHAVRASSRDPRASEQLSLGDAEEQAFQPADERVPHAGARKLGGEPVDCSLVELAVPAEGCVGSGAEAVHGEGRRSLGVPVPPRRWAQRGRAL